jgi:xanthine dehydrogenase YagR molybdenum-binding subunit
VHAYGVSSTVASGRVTRIDTTAARETPGVIDIFHHEHCPRLYRVPKMPISATGILTLSLTDENRALMSGDRSVDFADVLKAQWLASAEGEAHTSGAPTDKLSFRSFGAHFVEVRWDPGISHLRVARAVSAIDVGRVINPLTARNQVEGAIVMGVGMALFESTEYDGRTAIPANNNYAEYVVPVHADQQDIDVILLDYPDFSLNEFGARGIGEIGITGLAGAVANAVHHATGKRVRDLPITMEKLIDESTGLHD